ncbi:MAG: hypothetical protein NZZ41_03885 [Candidatus Dojkabacteria bacterium]|nr:hypothetical protein [Candidatus Dojkabacteria bacterium]
MKNTVVDLSSFKKKAFELENEVKKLYGTKKGLVRIANAKTLASYITDKDKNTFEWYVAYLENLKKEL